jgi:hypothetical protein
MSFEVLEELAEECSKLVPAGLEGWGSINLLRMSRSLFAHAWFNYDFLVLACLVGFQAVEAAFRDIYPDAGEAPFRALVRRSRKDEILTGDIADMAEAAVDLRNRLSHPRDQAAFTIGLAVPTLEKTHLLVVTLIAAADKT